MTHFQRKTHRAKRILDAVAREYPGAWDAFDRMRADKGSAPDFDWPSWCYMPIAGGYAVVSGGTGGRVPLHKAHHPAIVTALGTWRMTQGIYRFDPALRDALLDTPMDGDIPIEHLCRLPEWCVYIEIGGAVNGQLLHGAWVHMEYDANTEWSELRVVLDAAIDPRRPFDGNGLVPIALPLAGSIDASLLAIERSARRQAAALGVSMPIGGPPKAADTVFPAILSLSLYLCADADITRRGHPDTPVNPTPVKSKGRWVLYPASGPREWDIGVRIGAALRDAYRREQLGTGASTTTGTRLRPHIRRAHWHTIVSGPRVRDDGSEIPPQERRRDLRWLPPIPVGVKDPDALPATVRMVK